MTTQALRLNHGNRTIDTRRDYLHIAIQTLMIWMDRASQRRTLAEMPVWQLEDIGVSRKAADQESQKMFWIK